MLEFRKQVDNFVSAPEHVAGFVVLELIFWS